jgi:hypothetical protein
MEPKTIDKATSDKISFMTYIVPEFAAAYKMETQSAFFYLKKYGGWDFLYKHWKALHTANSFHVVDYLYRICYQNGGLR